MEGRRRRHGVAALLLTAAAAVACGRTGDNELRPDDAVAGASGQAGAEPECPIEVEPTGNAIVEGDVLLYTAQDLAALANVSEITGSLRLRQSFAEVLDLPSLRRIGGDLESDSSHATHVRLPNLQQIGGKLWFYLSGSLLELSLPALESIGGEVFVMRNRALTSVRLDSLTHVGGGIVFQAQLSLPACVTEPFPLLDSSSLANGDADQRCWCESPCGYPVARCP